MKIFKATRKYEAWLRQSLPVVEADLALKARRMAGDPFTFLRGTFYRWMQLFPEVCPKAWTAPVVLSVGDLHAANFGTWRDGQDRLVWGVNDLDEAAPLPYTLDLTRLAVSVELARASEQLTIGREEACEAILLGYGESLQSGGKPFVVDVEHEWLRKAYGKDERSADEYWCGLDDLPEGEVEIPAVVRTLIVDSLPAGTLDLRFKHRQAGMGSLGRPRFTALTSFSGERMAREVKPLLPSAAFWAEKKLDGASMYYEELLRCAVRSADPVVKVQQGWVLRRLAPDCRRIELSELGPERDEKRMMYAMGWETGNMHLVTSQAVKAVLEDLNLRKKDWLVKSARKMAEVTLRDWVRWKEENQ
jgi:hypothetical protein